MDEDKDKYKAAIFDGTNFSNWKFRLEVVLEEHELLEFLENSVEDIVELRADNADTAAEAEEKKKKRDAELKKERKCKSMIIKRIDDNHLEYVKDKKTPKDIWTSLIGTFERKGVASQLFIRKNLLTMKFEDGEKIEKHFLEFEKLIRELKSTGANMDEADSVCHLLLTLPKSFDPLVTALETVAPDKLTMSFVKGRLLDAENKRKNSEENVHSNQASSSAFTGNTKPNVKCFNCGKSGHFSYECRGNKPGNRNQRPNYRQRYQNSANISRREEEQRNDESYNTEANEYEYAFIENSEYNTFKDKNWYLDSGATDHMVNEASVFEDLKDLKIPIKISVAKLGQTIMAKQAGNIKVWLTQNGKQKLCEIKDVLFAPDLKCNLFSIQKVERNGNKIVFQNGTVKIIADGIEIATGRRVGKLYALDSLFHSNRTAAMISERKTNELMMWHKRYGHLGHTNLMTIIHNGMVDGMHIKPSELSKENREFCDACIEGKQSRNPFNASGKPRSSRPLELIHTDICGKIKPTTWDNKNYFVTFIDDYTHCTIVHLLKSKDEALNCFKEYEAAATAHFGLKISKLRCDKGGEYISNLLDKFCKEKGIMIEYANTSTPEQNGVSERMNRTLVEKARTMLIGSGMTKSFWSEAVKTAVYLTNRSPCSALETKTTPIEMWTGRKPNVSNLKMFGSIGYVHIPKAKRKKMDTKSRKCIMIGYTTNGYRLWNEESRKIVLSRDVVFNEIPIEHKQNEKIITEPYLNVEDEESDEGPMVNENIEDPPEDVVQEIVVQDVVQDVMQGRESDDENLTIPPAHDRPIRTKRIPKRFESCEMGQSAMVFVASESDSDTPLTFNDMKSSPDHENWENAVLDEIRSLEKNKTWISVNLPEGKKAINSKWTFKLKRDEHGRVKRYKARLVAKGYSQRKGFDYDEVFAPVVKTSTVRIVLAIANHFNYFIEHMDVKTAFLNGNLEEEVYMKLPEGFDVKNPYVKLLKSLYGLKQAPRCWNERLNDFLIKIKFTRSKADYCLYIKTEGNTILYVLVFVDDLMIVGNDIVKIKEIKIQLSKEFEMSDEGELKHFLGLAINRDKSNKILTISQEHYLIAILKKYQMENCIPISTPMECGLNLQSETLHEKEHTNEPYRELVGSLMFVMLNSRPDLSASVNYFSRFMNCATDTHWNHLKRILRYIKGTLDYKLVYKDDNNEIDLCGYADSDWANDRNDRKSITGYTFKLFGCNISWSTRKQHTVSLSSTEAEYLAVTQASCELLWIHSILEDLKVPFDKPTIIYEDNTACIEIAKHPQDQKRMKHVDVKHHFIREKITNNQIKLNFIPSTEQIADILTKPLHPKQFNYLRSKLGISSKEGC